MNNEKLLKIIKKSFKKKKKVHKRKLVYSDLLKKAILDSRLYNVK